MIEQPRRWHALVTLMQDMGLRRVVEVGCKEGRTTAYLLEHVPDCTVTAIDPWTEQPPAPGAETYADWDFGKIEAEFKTLTGPYADRLTFLRTDSSTAAQSQEPNSADLVFIDARHDYFSVIEDIRAWLPIVRPGGVLSGHDYQHSFPGVMRAVADSFNLLDVLVAPDSVWAVRIPQ